VKVIGVEPSGAAAMKASIDAGEPVTLPKTASVADGLMPVRPGDLTFAHVRRFADAVITVEDDEIVNAVLWTFANAKLVAEPSGAAAIAAVLYGALDKAVAVKGPVVAIVSGGNMGLEKLAEFAAAKSGGVRS
jgi:threonine dehydratase